MGVLNAAAIAAAAPTGINCRSLAGPRPSFLPKTDAIPAPICTDGPSRPSAIPEARDADETKNLPRIVLREMRPPCNSMALRVCGMPLPRASGKYFERSHPDASAPIVGTISLRQAAPPAGYIREPSRSVKRMNATTASPVRTPIITARTTRNCSSRFRNVRIQLKPEEKKPVKRFVLRFSA